MAYATSPPFFGGFYFFENSCAAGAEGAHGSGGVVGTGMVKGKWECNLYVKAKLRKGSEGGNGRRSPNVAHGIKKDARPLDGG